MPKNKLVRKVYRYLNLFKVVRNWPFYLYRKIIGFSDTFVFQIKGFKDLPVKKNMLGTFKESFFDDVYFRNIPEHIFKDKDNLTFIDIGANVGFFSLAAFTKFKNIKVYAFEPHPYCFGVLSDYQKKYQHLKWQVFNNAVGAKNEVLHLSTSTLDSFATMASSFEKESNTKTFSSEAIRLDSILDNEKIGHIDLLKLDCEGAEFPILYSLPESYFKTIDSLSIETHKGVEANQTTSALAEYLKNQGYNIKTEDEEKDLGYLWAWRG